MEIFNNIFNNTFLHALIFGMGIGLGLWFAPYLKDHLLWVKGGVENGDGKLENKELQITFFSILSAFMIVSVAIWHINYPDIAYIGVFGGAGVLYAINRAAEAYVKGKNKSSDNQSISDDNEGVS